MKAQNIFTMPFIILALMLMLAAQPASANRAARNAAAAVPAQTATGVSVALPDRHYTVEQLITMADMYREKNQTAALVNVLKRRAEMEPARFDIRLELGSIYVAQNKFDEAIHILNEASAAIPSDEAPHRLLAQVYQMMSNDSLRNFHLGKAAALAPRNFENQYNLAIYHMLKGRNAQGEELLQRSIELNGAFAPAKFEYGKLMLAKKDMEAAFRNFYEATVIEPENAIYQAYYAYAASLSGRTTLAADGMAAARNRAPRNATVLYVAALMQRDAGNLAAAEQSLRTALRYSPTDALANEALADVLAADFKYREASGIYLKIWQTAGYSDRVVFKLGTALAFDKKYREAVDFLEAVAARHPTNGEIAYRLIDVYSELGDMRKASATLARLGRNQSNAWYQASLGRIHEAAKELDHAFDAYTAAREFDSKNPAANAGLARILFQQGELDKALAFFKTASTLEPANMQNFTGMADVYKSKGNNDEAIKIYERMLERNQQMPGAYIAIAAIREAQGNRGAAIRSLLSGLEANERNTDLLSNLGRLYVATRQYEKAIDTYNTLIGRRPNRETAEFLRIIGEIYLTNLDDEKKAREFFRRYERAGGNRSKINTQAATQVVLAEI